ncbi:DUF2163 domain-containing protein [Rhizobium halophytocola]|uniref:Phage protein (TIGR02218 family) n=1 Tax=Rhizobium halophytocola TaxID=735519 RepID=A0ABS4DYX6_9HYPH|nr:DUF2163 domain-containing protein [Rhizobium halophytocola]MBP1850899.1 putative phage protein (TIGR02218 family) [Rhizobium halophytocola]
MKTLPDGLAARIATGATTLCQCWRVTRRDGVVLGFTEHDRDLVVGGTMFRAASGFRASETTAESGFAATGSTVTGGFSDAAITEEDLRAGRYDGARVEVLLVDWQTPDSHVLLRVEEIGEVSRAGGAFTAELRSLMHRLGQEKGRIFNRRCDAMLGDARCRVDLAAWRGNGVVTQTGTEVIRAAGLSSFAAGFFDRGVLQFSGGPLAGLAADLETTETEEADLLIRFFLPLDAAPGVGDGFSITAGCDKTFSTCRRRFGNGLNFRGFPHMPGSDFAYSYVDGETVHDGSPLYD